MRFVERFAALGRRGDWTAALRLGRRVCQRYAGIVPVARRWSARRSTCSRARAAPGRRPVDWTRVRGEVERLAAKPRLVRDPARHEAIDEIDVAIDDLMTRLDQSDVLTAEHSRAVSSWCARLAQRLALGKHDDRSTSRAAAWSTTSARSRRRARSSTRRARSPKPRWRSCAATPWRARRSWPRSRCRAPRCRRCATTTSASTATAIPTASAARAIPLAARIVSVADAFNAMIGRRPYRPPLAPSVALERLVETPRHPVRPRSSSTR